MHRIKDALHGFFALGIQFLHVRESFELYECVFAERSVRNVDTGYSKWRKLDNAALAFPLVTGKNDTRVFRFYCQLKEEVNPELLQQALDETMEKYPLFPGGSKKRAFLVLSGAQGHSASGKKGKKAALQQALHSG
ncbi:MAG: hypothetical protein V8S22_08760 [Lachnospiraceae bacterium]